MGGGGGGEMRRKRVGGLRWNEEENAEGGGRGAHERARGGRIPRG